MRVYDWQKRLQVVMAEWDSKTLVWGSSDCAAHAAACVEAVTGVDHYAVYRGKYSTEEGAAEIIRSAGFRDMGEWAASLFPAIPPSFAGMGDIGVVSIGDLVALGVFGHERVHVMRPSGRRGTVDRMLVTAAFRVE